MRGCCDWDQVAREGIDKELAEGELKVLVRLQANVDFVSSLRVFFLGARC